VTKTQEAGLKVINGAWAARGHHLKRARWGSFYLDPFAPGITR
jgi:hypothetical protein